MLHDYSLLEFLSKYEIICILETFYERDTLPNIFPNFKRFFSPAIRLSKYGHASGGVYVFVKSNIEVVEINVHNITDFTIALELKFPQENILFVSTYIPPQGSNYYNNNPTNGITSFENVLSDLKSRYKDHGVIVCGDFNARCGIAQPSTDDDLLDLYIGNDTMHDRNCCNNYYSRTSEDIVINTFGKLFTDMCQCLDLYIVNGTDVNTNSGAYTYIHPQGNSVVDYFLLSDDLLCNIDDFIVHEMIESLHMPISLSINLTCLTDTSDDTNSKPTSKLIWDNEKSGEYQRDFLKTFQEYANSLVDSIYTDIDKCVNDFSHMLTNCAHNMQVNFTYRTKPVPSKTWFDNECHTSKSLLRRSLHTYTNNRTAENKTKYNQLRKNYKYLLKRKRRLFNEKRVNKLCNNLNNPTNFWKEIKQIIKSTKPTNSIKLDQWFTYFKNIFQQITTVPRIFNETQDFVYTYKNADNLLALNEDIQIPEIVNAISKLKPNKSPGFDQVLSEMLKVNSNVIASFLQVLFTHIFRSGIFPGNWAKSIVVPIHKKGNPNLCDNYRPISLTSLVSKVYTHILNTRLTTFVEDEYILNEEQAGFRNGYSTVDNMYILYSMIIKQFCKNRKLYVAFIDFRKCFDSINRDVLFIILERNGITGNMLNSIKGMYSHVQAAVRSNGELSDFFDCPIGLKQGCQTSPKLFSIFATEFSRCLNILGKHGIQLNPGADIIHHLLFADDMALISDTISGLQSKLNILYDQCLRLGLEINLDKTNIVVFRKGGQLSKHEHWYYGPQNIKVVNMYRYLGIDFSSRMSFTACTTPLVAKAKQSAFQIVSSLYNCNCNQLKIFTKLFDAKIQPILSYGSEIWGLVENNNLEQVHTTSLKRFLGLSIHTSNTTLLAETSRYPLSITWKIKCIKFWLRIQEMPSNRFPRQACEMLDRLSSNGHITWSTHIKDILCKNGFGYVWLFRQVGCTKTFCQKLKYTLCANFSQNLNSKIDNSDNLQFYKSFKNIFETQGYLTNNLFSNHLRKLLIRFRLSVSRINCHRFKFSLDPEKRLCPLCKLFVEDEYHVIFICKFYENIRPNYLPVSARPMCGLKPMVELFSDEKYFYNLSRYLSQIFELRYTILKSRTI